MFSATCRFLRSVVEQCCVGEVTIVIFVGVVSHILAAGKAQQVSLNNPACW